MWGGLAARRQDVDLAAFDATVMQVVRGISLSPWPVRTSQVVLMDVEKHPDLLVFVSPTLIHGMPLTRPC